VPPSEPAPGPESPTPPSEPAPEAPEPPAVPEPTPPPVEPPPPAPAAVAVVVEPDAGGLELDVASLRELWPAVIDAVRGSNSLCAALLADAWPARVDGEQVVVAFPPDAGFARRRAEDESYRACVVEAIRAVTGRRARLAYELRDREAAPEPAAAPPAPTEEEWVQRFVAEFDAEEILPDPESEAR
jgi:hypothetical protein